MALIMWTSDYSVGVDSLDSDHIVFASIINYIDDANLFGIDKATIGRILEALIDHAHAHFRREEKLLEERGYPQLEEHKRLHRVMAEQLKDLHDRYQRSPDPGAGQEITELLCLWFDEHILKADMHYKEYLRDVTA